MNSRAWTAFLAMVATGLLANLLLLTPAKAQASNCFPLESLIEAVGGKLGQELVWTGITPAPNTAVRVMLFQSQSGAWTLVAAHGVTACIIGFGREGEAVATGLPI